MRRTLSRWFTICVSVVALTGCAAQIKRVPPDWQNPSHRLVGEQLSSVLRAAGRDPETCEVFFWETEQMGAALFGECMFGFTTGLADTGDAALVSAVAAHEVAHEVLGHLGKREAAIATHESVQRDLREIPTGWGAVASLGVMAIAMVALPAYARGQEAEADETAVEILRARGTADPAGTMAYALEVLIARQGAKGGGLLDSHPHATERVRVLRELQSQQPGAAPAQRAAARDDVMVVLPKAPSTPGFFDIPEPPDPTAGYSERYKRMMATAAAQAKEAERMETANETQALE